MRHRHPDRRVRRPKGRLKEVLLELIDEWLRAVDDRR